MSEPEENGPAAPESVISASSVPKQSIATTNPKIRQKPNIFIRFFRSVFGYRKTSLSLFVFLTIIFVAIVSYFDNSLEWSVSLPTKKSEILLLESSWSDLQYIGEFKHPYGSEGNKFVHDYLEKKVKKLIKNIPYIEYDDDSLNPNQSFLFKEPWTPFTYYESNNIVVRVNGSKPELPALLISSHYDSVPSSFGITDDGVGIASLLGVLKYLTSVAQPTRTIIFNFNNDEESGLNGAVAFLEHPWAKAVKYFINLEGTGQGGKAILFRGTDYGITKLYNSVRFPYASSLFQQAFNGRLIHSETDYKVYFENAGWRGIDIAFYKPRDIYHTGYDDIRHTSKKAVWHMLSSALDFVVEVSSKELDIDSEYLEDSNPKTQFAAFVSFLNYFIIISLPALIAINISALVIFPVASGILALIVFGYKKNWRLGFVNSVKFPVSLVLSIFVILFLNKILQQLFEFLPSSHVWNMVITLASVFFFTNYLILNGINFLFKNYKIVQHDEKLIVVLQISFIYWLLLIWSTVRISGNKIGNDHTGEALITVLFILQAIGTLFGLLGWSLKASKRELEYELLESGVQPLLVGQSGEYGASYDGHHPHPTTSDASSLISVDSYTARKKLSLIQKTFSYDWLIQFLIVAPIPLLIFYNNGWLILSGINKSIQETLTSENLIYSFIERIAIVLIFPLLPFIFKVNRIIIYVVIFGTILNLGLLFVASPFDIENPLKLRFIQLANLTESSTNTYVSVTGRQGVGIDKILSDFPSVKNTEGKVHCSIPVDGLTDCRYKTSLFPQLVPGAKDFSDYLSIDVLKNSSSNDYPYGLLGGEILIDAPGSSSCRVKFDSSRKTDFPVKTVKVFNDVAGNSTALSTAAIPEGFSKDKDGNYIYKDLSGIPLLELKHLNTQHQFHVSFQWVPSLLDEVDTIETSSLKVDVECLWSNLGDGDALVPAYKEVNQYSPLFVSWANQRSGMVAVSSSIEV